MMKLISAFVSYFQDRSKIAQMLIVDEAKKNKPYKDTKDYWTIGIGHYIGDKLEELTLSDRVVNQIFKEDFKSARRSLIKIFGKQKVSTWTKPRKHAVINLIFNLGETRFLGFHDTIDHIKHDRWVQASNSARDSKWYKDVKSKRGERICQTLETGEYHEDYKIS